MVVEWVGVGMLKGVDPKKLSDLEVDFLLKIGWSFSWSFEGCRELLIKSESHHENEKSATEILKKRLEKIFKNCLDLKIKSSIAIIESGIKL